MPRLLRKDILFKGCFAHVISRSIRIMKIFKDDKYFQALRELFIYTKKKFNYKIQHSYKFYARFHLRESI